MGQSLQAGRAIANLAPTSAQRKAAHEHKPSPLWTERTNAEHSIASGLLRSHKRLGSATWRERMNERSLARLLAELDAELARKNDCGPAAEQILDPAPRAVVTSQAWRLNLRLPANELAV